jgi:CBS domain-containing protein
MENSIAARIGDFMKRYPPFHLLGEDRLHAIAQGVTVQYRKLGEYIFQQGERPGRHIYMVREGAIRLTRETAGERILVDQCDEGDIFGLRPLLAGEAYALSAQAQEETLLYAIETEGMSALLEEQPRVASYIARAFAAGWHKQRDAAFRGHIFLDRDLLVHGPFHLAEVQLLEHSRAPVTCPPHTLIRDAARIMSAEEVGSILIVDENKRPLGIITDRDLRNRVVTGKTPAEAPVSAIMSSPVITMPPNMTVADAQIVMLKKHIHHICLTEDGSPASPAAGVISEHDILVVQGNNPATIIREINRASDTRALRQVRENAEELLRKYLYQEIAIGYISSIMTAINDALAARCVTLAQEDLANAGHAAPDLAFSWLALGSHGREEQLLRTDQDNALIFDNVPAEALEPTRRYFLEMAQKASAALHECGYEYCPGEMMARNPRWCLSLDEWKKQFFEWINTPSVKALMHATIFFDYRPVFGGEGLSRQLTDYLFSIINEQSAFLSFLAKDALQNPAPLTFFRNFVVEKSGEHKDAFDIKARAMMPLTDAARVLTLAAGLGGVNNTFQRFARLAELEPQNAELYEQAAEAYEILMRYRALRGLKNNDSGRYFKPSELSKMEKLNLRNSFRPIGELQSLLATRFQTAYFH